MPPRTIFASEGYLGRGKRFKCYLANRKLVMLHMNGDAIDFGGKQHVCHPFDASCTGWASRFVAVAVPDVT